MEYKNLENSEIMIVKQGNCSAQTLVMVEELVHKDSDVSDVNLNEISEWLRDHHMLNVNIRHAPHSQKYSFRITGSYHEGEAGVLNNSTFMSHESYYEALDKGVFEALKLICEGRDINKIRGLDA